MTSPAAPPCPRHDGRLVAMKLRSLHTDSARPEQLIGLFECPECGEERRVAAEAELAEDVEEVA